jgi:hypothetical protein
MFSEGKVKQVDSEWGGNWVTTLRVYPLICAYESLRTNCSVADTIQWIQSLPIYNWRRSLLSKALNSLLESSSVQLQQLNVLTFLSVSPGHNTHQCG